MALLTGRDLGQKDRPDNDKNVPNYGRKSYELFIGSGSMLLIEVTAVYPVQEESPRFFSNSRIR